MRSLILLAGVTLAVWLPPQAGLPLLLPAAVLLLAGAALLSRTGLALLLVLAFVLTRLVVAGALGQQLPCEERVIVAAQVLDVPARAAGGWRFDALLHHPRQAERGPLKARVEFPGSGADRPRAGETWQLLVRYTPLGAGVVRGAADPRRFALRDGLQARARVIRSPLNRRLAPAGASLHRLREHVAGSILRQVEDPSASALLAALAVGVTGEISRQQWRDFSATGITHLIAISGMHVTFFALLSMALARRLWNAWPELAAGLRRETFAVATGLLLATGYALLSGFSVPAQRTLLMLAAWMLGRECARASGPCWSVAVALCAVLAIDPLAVIGAGFWLSFAAVVAIIMVPGSRLRAGGTLHAAADVQFSVSFALLPLTVLMFGTFSFAGLVVNAFAIPVFTFVLVPGALFATLGYLLPFAPAAAIADWLISLTGAVAAQMLPWLGRAAEIPGAVWRASPEPLWLLLAFIALPCLLLPLRPSLRCASLGVLLLGFAGSEVQVPRGAVDLQVLGAGADTAVVVTTARHRLVFGTAEVRGSDGRRFEQRVLPRLLVAGVPPTVLIVGGTLSADRLAALTLSSALLGPAEFVGDSVRQLPPEIRSCAQRSWWWDGVRFTLAPAPEGRGCSLEITVSHRRALLLLDVAAAAWHSLEPRELAGFDVVLLPAAAKPFAADWPAQRDGRRATFIGSRIPGSATRERWRLLRESLAAAGIRLIDLAAEGALSVRLDVRGEVRLRRLDRWSWGAWSVAPDAGGCST